MGRALLGGQDAVQVGLVRDGLILDSVAWSDSVEVPPDEVPPESIQRFIEESDAVTPASDSITNVLDVGKQHGRRRYREAVIRPGNPCYVLGTTDGDGVLSADAGPLTMGSGHEADLRARKERRARLGGAVGIVSLLGGMVATGLLIL